MDWPYQIGKKYYHACLLTACVDWFKWPEDKFQRLLEQEGWPISLMDWLVQDNSVMKDLTNASRSFNLLGKTWLRYKKILLPAVSPLQKLLNHSEFRHLKAQGNLAPCRIFSL